MNKIQEVTKYLVNINEPDQQNYNQLFTLVYDELLRIANIQLNREYGNHTLSRTELVHETFLKLVDQTQINFNDRMHFYAIAARSVRQILVDYARKKKAEKRGGDQRDITFDEAIETIDDHTDSIIEIDHYMDELRSFNERLAQLVELRFFVGFNIEEAAEIMEISTSTANRDWDKAKGWLYQRMKPDLK